MWGADVTELRTLAQQFGRTADLLLQQSTQLTSHINSTTSWKGQDAVAFRSDWNGSHRAMLQQAAFALKQESKKLLENASQQETASDAGSVSVSAPVGPHLVAAPAVSPSTVSSERDPYFWEHEEDDTWWDSYVSKPWDVYKVVPDTLRTVSLPFQGGTELASWHNAFNFAGTSNKYWDALNSPLFTKAATALDKAADLAEGGDKVFAALKGLKTFGNVLGGVGAAIDAGSAINSAVKGDYGDAAWSTTKAALGVAAMFPGPQQPFLIAANVGVAVWENREKIADGVGWVADKVGEGASAVIKDPAKILPWNW
ncbi:hypothetical protein [Pseudarthrobacter sp. W1I19]|uniref:hypothetical protein n=1 Tax=Pseudarthrobacter sp. W1I19 TaxID=3042288 RepID=UPI0027D86794|nr:hypothetical protein [Pseudarthrobacter sp. W1I19]